MRDSTHELETEEDKYAPWKNLYVAMFGFDGRDAVYNQRLQHFTRAGSGNDCQSRHHRNRERGRTSRAKGNIDANDRRIGAYDEQQNRGRQNDCEFVPGH